MTIKIGVYDFFAYTIPGLLYLANVAYGLSIFKIIRIDFHNLELSVVTIIGLLILAYITGLILEPIAAQWHRLYWGSNFPQKVFLNFQKRHPKLKLDFDGNDWPLLLAKIRVENLDLAGEIEKFSATNIMLRNISLSLLIALIITIIQYLQSPTDYYLLGIILIFIITSFIASKRSVTFARYYYSVIFEVSTELSSSKSSVKSIKSKKKINK